MGRERVFKVGEVGRHGLAVACLQAEGSRQRELGKKQVFVN